MFSLTAPKATLVFQHQSDPSFGADTELVIIFFNLKSKPHFNLKCNSSTKKKPYFLNFYHIQLKIGKYFFYLMHTSLLGFAKYHPQRLCKYYIKSILWINKKYVMYLPSTYRKCLLPNYMGIMNITLEVASKIDKHTLFNPLFLCIFYSFPITTQQHCAMDLSRVRISSINLLCIY